MTPEKVARKAILNWINSDKDWIHDFAVELAEDDLPWDGAEFGPFMDQVNEWVYNILVNVRHKVEHG